MNKDHLKGYGPARPLGDKVAFLLSQHRGSSVALNIRRITSLTSFCPTIVISLKTNRKNL